MTNARYSRTWLWLLLAAALFTRALLPPGYMPERSDSGAIAIKLCGTHGVWLLPSEKGATPKQDRQGADQPCAFAGLAAASPPPDLPELLVPTLGTSAFGDAREVPKPSFAARWHPPARGPPLPV